MPTRYTKTARLSGSVSGESIRTRRTVPDGSSTSLPSVAAIVPPPPIRMPASAPFAPPRIAPRIAPAPAPMPIFSFSPMIPSLSSACDTVARIGYERPLIVTRSKATVRLPFALGARRRLHRAHDAAHQRAGRHQHAAALIPQIDHRRRLEAILDLGRLRAQRVLQPDVELGADRNLVRVLRPHRLSLGPGRGCRPEASAAIGRRLRDDQALVADRTAFGGSRRRRRRARGCGCSRRDRGRRGIRVRAIGSFFRSLTFR